MSKQQNNKTAFFETENDALNIESEINLYNGFSVEFDYNNQDFTQNFSLALDLTALS